MARIGTAKVDINKVAYDTAAIVVKPKGLKKFGWRCKLSTFFLALASWVSPFEIRMVDKRDSVISPGDGWEFCGFDEAVEWYDFHQKGWKLMGHAGFHREGCNLHRKPIGAAQ